MTDLCDEVYVRHSDNRKVVLLCQYIKDHPADRHSWFAIKHQDEVDALILIQTAVAPNDVKRALSLIDNGTFDPYLEAILNAAHNRKRALRGVRGFPRYDRATADG